MQKPYILYVEDDSDDRELFEAAVSSFSTHCQFHCAEDGREAITFLNSSVDLPRCIITDINMPRMNGIDLVKYLRSDFRYAIVPIVVFTTTAYELQEAEANDLGVDSFLTKPDDFNKLTSLVRNLLTKYCE